MSEANPSLSERIHKSEKSHKPVETILKTDQKVLARITDGIYRQPASALRELISNAYDADATEVIIFTDAPRFGYISVRDDGHGLSPEMLEHLVEHIGGSAKRSSEGIDLGITSKDDENLSPGGRKLIGKLGIGLFSVAQFTRHFLIITKTPKDKFRTIADITLGPVAGQEKKLSVDNRSGQQEIQTGHARIWRENAEDADSHGTEIKLLDLLPRTRAELASADLWAKIDFQKEDPDSPNIEIPRYHIGRMKPKQTEVLEIQPELPWSNDDSPKDRFSKFVQAVRGSIDTSDSVDLDILCDRYLQTLWNLALAAPLEYIETHPFDLPADKEIIFFELENKPKGQAKRLSIKTGDTPRKELRLKSPNGAHKDSFKVFIDGIQLFRPIVFKNLPKTSTAVQTPLLFIGSDSQRFEKKPIDLSGGPLVFEAYLFWAPKIIPKQHQGVILRIGNASGSLFDKTFMSYQVSEQTRTRQITAEVFVREGLDGALNLDRESFNFAHPHYQYILKWLHSALRQLANKHKELGKSLRTSKVTAQGEKVRAEVEKKVVHSLKLRGVDDLPEVILIEKEKKADTKRLRNDGAIVLQKDIVVPPSNFKNKTGAEGERRKNAERKAVAIAQLLHGWGLLENLSFDDQEKLIRDILEIVFLD